MPPKKRVTKVEEPPKPDTDSSSDEDVPVVTQSIPTQSFTKAVSVKYNQNDNDRLQLAQAINNLTVKGEQFMEAFSTFSKFRETLAELDIQIDTKKKEYKELCDKVEKDYKEKNHLLEREFKDKTHLLEREYTDKQKQLSNTYSDTNRDLQNDYKNKQIEVTQKLKEFKLKGCQDIAKEFDMIVLKSEDHKNLNDVITKTQRELDDLKKKFDSSCNAIRAEEKAKYDTELKRQKLEQELTYKTNTAEMKAQLDQQKREVDMLNKTIESLKGEISEQRQLTIEIAQANSKAQITQNFKKE